MNLGAQIANFWRWFAEHQENLISLNDPDAPFWDEALDELKKVDARLWMELSANDVNTREFIVTAQGHSAAFPVAEALVRAAPVIDGWDFTALKPALGFTFTTKYEDTDYIPAMMWFLPLQRQADPKYLGLRIGIPGLDTVDTTSAHNAVLIILDTALGERSAAMDIQYTEVCELPPEPEKCGYIELPEVAEYIAWRKRKTLSN